MLPSPKYSGNPDGVRYLVDGVLRGDKHVSLTIGISTKEATMNRTVKRRWGGGAMMIAGGAAIIIAVAGPFPARRANAQSGSQSFPYGRELRLDADRMRGTRKIPILDIGTDGTADIEMWCNSVKAQLIVAANTITIITGATSSRQCGPDLLRADDDLLTALTQASLWRMDDTALVLMGGRTLRFVVQTN
jgi:heat shock protein HslJ